MNTVITVENLGKKYTLRHQSGQQPYVALRDVLTEGVKNAGRRFSSLFTQSPVPSPQSLTSEDFWALKDVSFEVKQGDRIGIIGRNGAGKSTLLKILSRITEPTTGSVRIKGRVASLLEVGTGFHPELTGRENIFLNGAILGMGRAEIKKKFDEIVDFAEIEKFLDTPVKRYSSGMYVRLAFAVAAHLEPEILIVDEVLAVGDAQFQKKCLGKMEDVSAKEGRTVLFVSHNMGAITTLCNLGIFLASGAISCSGSITSVVNTYNASYYTMTKYLPGVLYNIDNKQFKKNKFQILSVTLLDNENNLKESIKTWDDVTLRIKFYSPNHVLSGAIEIWFSTLLGFKIAELSTKPLSGVGLSFSPGSSYIDCRIPRIPLAAGEYKISVFMAIPMVDWLYKGEDLGTFVISENDIYNSGCPPQTGRTIMSFEHYWLTPE